MMRDEIVQCGNEKDPMRLNMYMAPKTRLPVMHSHLRQTETYRVLDGVFELKVGGRRMSLRPGEGFAVPPATPHTVGNNLSTPTIVYVEFFPGLRMAEFFERLATFEDDPALIHFIKFSSLVREYPIEQHYPLPMILTFGVLDVVGRLLRINRPPVVR